jgi:hypothetical protein
MSMSEYSEGRNPPCPSCDSLSTERSFSAVGVLTGSSRGRGSSSSGAGSCGPPSSGFT